MSETVFPRKHNAAVPDIGFRYLVDEESEYALRDVTLALHEISCQFDRPDAEEMSGPGMAALLRTIARSTGNVACAMAPAPKSFRQKMAADAQPTA